VLGITHCRRRHDGDHPLVPCQYAQQVSKSHSELSSVDICNQLQDQARGVLGNLRDSRLDEDETLPVDPCWVPCR